MTYIINAKALVIIPHDSYDYKMQPPTFLCCFFFNTQWDFWA